MNLSRRPYLMRAMHEWMSDSNLTPHMIVDALGEGVQVPRAYVKDGKVVLNVSYSATQRLTIGAEWVEFGARFGGIAHQVRVPLGAVLGIYARETGEGMAFSEPPLVDAAMGAATHGGDSADSEAGVTAKPKSELAARRARLTVVK